METHPFHGIDGGELFPQAGEAEHGLGILPGAVGKQQLAPGQMLEHGFEAPLQHQHGLQVRELVGMVEKVLRGDVVMSHQPQQGGTVALPVVLAQLGSGAFRQVQPLHHKRRHGPVDMGKNVGAGVVQGIVQIEDPDRSGMGSGHGEWPGRMAPGPW